MNVSPLQKDVLILCSKEQNQNANIVKKKKSKAFSISMLVCSLVLRESMNFFVRNRNISIVEYTEDPGNAERINNQFPLEILQIFISIL